MRKIKFRAWDVKYQKYITWEEISEARLLGVLVNNYNRGISNCALEQCTGMLDKNGNEIYEGDILSYYTDTEEGGNTFFGVVLWNKEYGGYDVKFEGFCNGTEPLSDFRLDSEVVGNTRENPGLLVA